MVNQHVEMTAIPAAAMTGQERLIVLIATRDRPDLLGQCSLPSVLQQTRAPDAVIVVDDSEDALTSSLTQSAVMQHKPAFLDRGVHLVLLANTRTPGASGAWNTGLLHAMVQEQQRWQQHQGPSGLHSACVHCGSDPCSLAFIAILDDDDCWEPNHLQVCWAAVTQHSQHQSTGAQLQHSRAEAAHTKLCQAQSAASSGDPGHWQAMLTKEGHDGPAWHRPQSLAGPSESSTSTAAEHQEVHMAVSGLIRHCTPSTPQPLLHPASGHRQSLPQPGWLQPGPFTAGNPHVQGSNLFCRLDKLLAAGGFNEHLPSTTDRDLCIRLAGVGTWVAVTNTHTVHHFVGVPAPGLAGAPVAENALPAPRVHRACAESSAAAASAGAAGMGFGAGNQQPGSGASGSMQSSFPAGITQAHAAAAVGDQDPPSAHGVPTGSSSSGSLGPGPGPGSSSGRLSDPFSAAKWIGLNRFYHDIWGPLMSAEEQQAAKARALSLFGVQLDPGSTATGATGLTEQQHQQLAASAEDTISSSASNMMCKLLPGRGCEPPYLAVAAQQQLLAAQAAGLCSKASWEPECSEQPAPHACRRTSVPAVTAARQDGNLQPVVLVVGVVSSSAETVSGLLSDLLLLMQQSHPDVAAASTAGDRTSGASPQFQAAETGSGPGSTAGSSVGNSSSSSSKAAPCADAAPAGPAASHGHPSSVALSLGGLEVVLLENGPAATTSAMANRFFSMAGSAAEPREAEVSQGNSLSGVAAHYQQLGLPVHFISRSQQVQLAAAGLVPADLADKLLLLLPHSGASHTAAAAVPCSSAAAAARQRDCLAGAGSAQGAAAVEVQQLPIGDMRTLLQLYLAAFVGQLPARCRSAAVVWVLDDDKRLMRRPEDPGKVDTTFLHILQHLAASKAADVVLGTDVGAPPLPAAACVRLGLLDVVSNLRALAKAHVPTDPSAQHCGTVDASSHSISSGGSGSRSSRDGPSSSSKGSTSPQDSRSSQPSLAATGSPAAAFNAAAISCWGDFYYDLSSSHTSHLEVPFRTAAYQLAAQATAHQTAGTASDPAAAQQTAGTASDPAAAGSALSPNLHAVSCFRRLQRGLHGLLHGVPFLRSLQDPTGGTSSSSRVTEGTASSSSSTNTVTKSRNVAVAADLDCSSCGVRIELEPSVHRGGSTFVLNHAVLSIPQHAFPARRSDMMWCLAVQSRGLTVKRCKQLPIIHSREPPCTPTKDTQGLGSRVSSETEPAGPGGKGMVAGISSGHGPDDATNTPASRKAAVQQCNSHDAALAGPTCSSSSSSSMEFKAPAVLANQCPFLAGLVNDIQGHSLYMALQDGLISLHEGSANCHGSITAHNTASWQQCLDKLTAEHLLRFLQARRLHRAAVFDASGG